MVRRFMSAASAVLLMLGPIAGANAAELKVLAGGSMTDSLHEIGPQFERATGHKLVFLFAGTPELIRQATSGAPFDLGVVPIDVMSDAAARARFAAGPTTDISRVGYGIAFKSGAPKPDVGTPDALKAALLQAQSVTLRQVPTRQKRNKVPSRQKQSPSGSRAFRSSGSLC
jgi:molybdate transport system substrate-binding protein